MPELTRSKGQREIDKILGMFTPIHQTFVDEHYKELAWRVHSEQTIRNEMEHRIDLWLANKGLT